MKHARVVPAFIDRHGIFVRHTVGKAVVMPKLGGLGCRVVSAVEFAVAALRRVLEGEWRDVGLDGGPILQVRAGLNDILASRDAGYIEDERSGSAG